jgi:predicted AAA+ superfamily ATPase
LQPFPVVALLGPRQVGKTTLATMRAAEEREHALYLDLELPSDQAKLVDPELYFASHEDKLVYPVISPMSPATNGGVKPPLRPFSSACY